MKLIENPSLPKDIFGQVAKPQLLSQAVRVYLSNQKQGTQSAKTRAEVNRTRKKLYRQKGTGGARHGDRKAPIFVGGGVSFAPKPKDRSMSFPKKMRKLALSSALSLRAKEKKISVVSDMDNISGKTKELAGFIDKLNLPSDKLLLVTDSPKENIYRAGRNIPNVVISPLSLLNVYEVLRSDHILITEEALGVLAKRPSDKGSQKAVEKTAKKVSKPEKPAKKVVTKKIIKKVKTKTK